MKLFTMTLLLALNSYALSNSVAAEDKGWQSNILLSIPSFDDTNDKVTGYCNGTLIDSNTLISAAHCFVRSEVLTGKKFKIAEYRNQNRDCNHCDDRFGWSQLKTPPAEPNFCRDVRESANRIKHGDEN